MNHPTAFTRARRLALASLAVLSAQACNADLPAAPPHLADVRMTLTDTLIELGQRTVAMVAAFDQYGRPFGTRRVEWTSAQPTVAAVSEVSGAIFGIAPGRTEINARVDGRLVRKAIVVAAAPTIRINEVKTDGERLSGWIEFYNPGTSAVDVSGWSFTDGGVFVTYILPPGSVIAAGGFLVVDESSLPFGLDGEDHALLFSRFGILVDSRAWTGQSALALGVCPDGAGALVPTIPTRGAANDCPPAGTR